MYPYPYPVSVSNERYGTLYPEKKCFNCGNTGRHFGEQGELNPNDLKYRSGVRGHQIRLDLRTDQEVKGPRGYALVLVGVGIFILLSILVPITLIQGAYYTNPSVTIAAILVPAATAFPILVGILIPVFYLKWRTKEISQHTIPATGFRCDSCHMKSIEYHDGNQPKFIKLGFDNE